MDIHVFGDGSLQFGDRRMRCAIGWNGVAETKREGDGVTPIGCFPLRFVLYRPDRIAPPATAIAVRPIRTYDGWCDDPNDPAYNRSVELPYDASAEKLWRDDGVYDVVVVLGHNDDPPVPWAGSAIFLHVARRDFAPTEGCVALRLCDLLYVLASCGPDDRLCVKA